MKPKLYHKDKSKGDTYCYITHVKGRPYKITTQGNKDGFTIQIRYHPSLLKRIFQNAEFKITSHIFDEKIPRPNYKQSAVICHDNMIRKFEKRRTLFLVDIPTKRKVIFPGVEYGEKKESPPYFK